MGKTKISSSLKENETYIRERCRNCADILIRPMRLGTVGKTDCLMVYICLLYTSPAGAHRGRKKNPS